MTITTEHAASSYGQPVILGDDGQVMNHAPGVRAVRRRLGLNTAALGAACGVSGRTVEGWEQGRHAPPASALFVMAGLLAGQGAKATPSP